MNDGGMYMWYRSELDKDDAVQSVHLYDTCSVTTHHCFPGCDACAFLVKQLVNPIKDNESKSNKEQNIQWQKSKVYLLHSCHCNDVYSTFVVIVEAERY